MSMSKGVENGNTRLKTYCWWSTSFSVVFSEKRLAPRISSTRRKVTSCEPSFKVMDDYDFSKATISLLCRELPQLPAISACINTIHDWLYIFVSQVELCDLTECIISKDLKKLNISWSRYRTASVFRNLVYISWK